MIRRFSDEYRSELHRNSDNSLTKSLLKRSEHEELYDTEEMNKLEVNLITFDTMMFIRIFLDLDFTSNLELIPSVYLREMTFSHQERQNSLRSTLRKHNHLLTSNYPDYIKLTPPIVVFQNCEPDEISTIKLSIMNTGKKPICIQASVDCQNAFSVKNISKGDKHKKIAQGIENVFEIQFRPSHLKDYFQTMKILVADDEFDLPFFGRILIKMACLGPRALIDFPDVIEMPAAPVKLQVTKTVILKNIGRARGVVNFSVEKPFSVVPEKIYLDTEKELAWKIEFISNTKGLFYKQISVLYENGELLKINAMCTADNLNISINHRHIDFEEVFIGNKKSYEIEIHNESAYLVQFHFLKYKTLEEDKKSLARMNKKFFQLKEIGYKKSALIDYEEITLPGVHEAASERIFSDQVKFTSIKDLMFKNANFEVLPNEGDIWPWTSSTVTLIFSPTEVGKCFARAFCEIQGREERIVIELKGIGIGPKLSLNVDTVDFGYIFFCSVHKFELLAKNLGSVTGTLQFLKNKLIFGGVLNCTPDELTLVPGEIKPFLLTMSSKTVGQFVEEIYFLIKESNKQIKCVIKGKVVSPRLMFSEDRLDFGEVPLGFPVTHNFSIHNESPVKVPFIFKVMNDGQELALTCWNAERGEKLAMSPKEFIVTPLEGGIEPNETINVSVSY
uniref:MSP domain-containing protein n=1 Tax=Rhodnius prolixus TaxID=13249 RepID=T1HAY7_RHOPR